MHRGVPLDFEVGAFFLFFFCANSSFKSSFGSSWISPHLRKKVSCGLDTELSPNGAHSSWNMVSTKWASPCLKVMSLPLSIPFCHSIFLSCIDYRKMGSIGVCPTMVFPIICCMKLMFSLHGSGPRGLLVPLSTTAECGLQCTHLFLRILLLPLDIPGSCPLKFLLLAMY